MIAENLRALWNQNLEQTFRRDGCHWPTLVRHGVHNRTIGRSPDKCPDHHSARTTLRLRVHPEHRMGRGVSGIQQRIEISLREEHAKWGNNDTVGSVQFVV